MEEGEGGFEIDLGIVWVTLGLGDNGPGDNRPGDNGPGGHQARGTTGLGDRPGGCGADPALHSSCGNDLSGRNDVFWLKSVFLVLFCFILS